MTSALFYGAALAALLASAPIDAVAQSAAPAPSSVATFVSDTIPSPHILTPDGEAKAMVFLISDSGGWTDKEAGVARQLQGEGSYVIGVDLPAYLATLEKDDGDCIYTLSDIEKLSQQVQRSAGGGIYHLPIVVGIGAGGAMALAIAAQTPAATVEHTVAVDPAAGIALERELCTPAKKTKAGGLAVYGLTDGDLPDPIDVSFTDDATDAGKAHVDALVADHSDIDVATSDDDAMTTLKSAIDDVIEAPDSDELGLPVTVLEATPTRDTMAIVYSGDGGWRDLDKEIGDAFQKDGVPTIGVDSLRYFWSEQTPQSTAADLKRIIDLYSKRWNVRNVILVGFSFGADILPSTFNMLAPAEQAKVREISLLALSKSATFQVSVSGWLGVGDDGNEKNPEELKRIDPKLVQCLYGTDDEDSVCGELKPLGIELIAVDGGHHFDGDYEALAKKILDGLDERVGRAEGAAKQ